MLISLGQPIAGMNVKSGTSQEEMLETMSHSESKDTIDCTSTTHTPQTAEKADFVTDIVAKIAELQREAFSLGTAALVCGFLTSQTRILSVNNWSCVNVQRRNQMLSHQGCSLVFLQWKVH